MNHRLLLSLFVTICGLLVVTTAKAQNTALVGDMDGDGYITITDITLLVNTLLGLTPERTLRLAEGETPGPSILDDDTHQYVDLGLPSGTLWATCNVGATAPEDDGDYFAWGEVETKSYFAWSNYNLCQGNGDNLTRYCTKAQNGRTDGITTLLADDDAATVAWGRAWTMPTQEQAEELLSADNTLVTPTTRNGKLGYTIKSLKSDASIFIPAAGQKVDKTVEDKQSAYYWTKTLDADNPTNAYYLGLDANSSDIYKAIRVFGRNIRPVRMAQAKR